MKLEPVTGPLETGTYMVHAVFNEGQYHALHEGKAQLTLTDDHSHDGVQWDIVKVGENKIRARNKNHLAAPAVQEGNVVSVVEDEVEWFVKETDVKGEYIGSPAHDENLYVSATKGSAEVRVGSENEMSRFKIYRVIEE